MYIKNARVHICFIQYCLVVHLYGRDKYIITVWTKNWFFADKIIRTSAVIM